MAECHYRKDSITKLGKLYQLKPEILQAFMDFDGKVFAEGALSTKIKELIAVACAHVTQCPYCIEAHTKRAKKAGALRMANWLRQYLWPYPCEPAVLWRIAA